ncbi:MAG: glycosyltransferase family 39 protein [Pseudomonadota bacterium]
MAEAASRKTPKGVRKGQGGAKAGGAKAGGAKAGGAKKPRGKAAKVAAEAAEARGWALAAAALICALLFVRLGLNATGFLPPHFDEAQYWAYGLELDWGYFSKPPGVGALIRMATEGFGDTLFALRLPSPLAHAGIAALIYLTAARIWDGRTGFWAAAGYSLAPGVGLSALIVSTDPPMMLGWALALYAMVRAGEDEAWRGWWVVLGAAIGFAFLAKYTALAFFAGALGYGLFSARGRDMLGVVTAGAAALAVMTPNLLWNAENGFATVAHVAEDADPGRGYGNPIGFLEFLGAQFGVIGPVFFLAILAALATWRGWREDWGMRLMAWQTVGLLLPIAVLAFATRAQPNWAAPAYVAGSILAARWLVTRDWRRGLLWGQAVLGGGATALVIGLGAIYSVYGTELPRAGDPFKKLRIAEPFCARALAAMDEEGVEVLLGDGRRRLSECMVLGGLGWDRVAVWNPDLFPDSHHELVATLQPGDDRAMLLAILNPSLAQQIAARFDLAVELEVERFATHGDRSYPLALWRLEGFRGYDATY